MSVEDAIKDHATEKRLFLVRVVTAAFLLVLLVGLIVTRVVFLQGMNHAYYETQSKANRMRVQVVPPVRGLIFGRNGTVLADNLPAYRIDVIPDQVENLKNTLDRLSKIIDISQNDRTRFLKRVAQTPSFRSVPLRLDIGKREAARFEVNSENFPGFILRGGLNRHYPLGKAAAHLIGYVGDITARDLRNVNKKRYRGSSVIGKSGVEKSYESQLHGYPGSRVVETDAAGRSLRELNRNPPAAGDNITLTIDARLQKVAYRAMGDQDGAAIAINPNTGGVLAMVSTPGYQPHLFINGISQKNYDRLLHDPGKPLFNRALQGQYPPGSTIKPVMAIGALETHSVDPNKKVWCPGYITLPGSSHHYRDWKRAGQGWLTLHQAIVRSSDVYFYKLGLKLGIDNIHRYATMFGLGHKTGIDLPRENSGLVPSRNWKHGHFGVPWYPGETLNTVIGQGYTSATPLQLAKMVSQIAERGHGFKPHVLKSWQAPGSGEVHRNNAAPLQPIQLKDKRDWRIVIDSMRDVVSGRHGTARRYVGKNLEYPIAGKSGTAQVKALPQGRAAPNEMGGPRRLRPHALFIAFSPIEHPLIAVAVVVEHGGGGSSIAGPIAKKIIDRYLDRKNPREVSGTPHS